MKKECHDAVPPELLPSWTPAQLEYMHDTAYWADTDKFFCTIIIRHAVFR